MSQDSYDYGQVDATSKSYDRNTVKILDFPSFTDVYLVDNSSRVVGFVGYWKNEVNPSSVVTRTFVSRLR